AALFQVWRWSYLVDLVEGRRPLSEDALARWLVPSAVRSGALDFDGMIGSILEGVRTLEIALVVLAVPAAVLWCVFLFRIRANALALGAQPRFARHWILTGFLVPFLNLVRPFQVVDDLWRSSARAPGEPGRSSVLARVWWESVLVANAVAFLATWRFGRLPMVSAGWIAAAAVARVALFVVSILLVRGLAEMQTARAAGREPGAEPLGALPRHAGTDLGFLALLAVAIWCAFGLGARGEQTMMTTGEALRESTPLTEPAADAPTTSLTDADPPLALELGGIEGNVEGGIEGGVEGGAVGGMVGEFVGGVEGTGLGGAVGADEPERAGEPLRVVESLRIHGNPPAYPVSARQAGIQGTVMLEVVVDRNGRVESARILKGVHPALDAAALAAVKSWVYRPTMVGGRAVRVLQTESVVFRLQ
ncbi:MAG: TonB family protein, partial [Candidatus Binatia bacterium]